MKDDETNPIEHLKHRGCPVSKPEYYRADNLPLVIEVRKYLVFSKNLRNVLLGVIRIIWHH